MEAANESLMNFADVLKPKEAAAILRMTTTRVRELFFRGQLKGFTYGKKSVRITRESILALLNGEAPGPKPGRGRARKIIKL